MRVARDEMARPSRSCIFRSLSYISTSNALAFSVFAISWAYAPCSDNVATVLHKQAVRFSREPVGRHATYHGAPLILLFRRQFIGRLRSVDNLDIRGYGNFHARRRLSSACRHFFFLNQKTFFLQVLQKS